MPRPGVQNISRGRKPPDFGDREIGRLESGAQTVFALKHIGDMLHAQIFKGFP
jgi:hypothetical protein